MSVARTVVELDIEHAYIMATDTEKRWDLYVAFEDVTAIKIANATSVLHHGKVDAKAIATIADRAKAARTASGDDRNWAGRGIDLRRRAIATKRTNQYDLVYRDMCGASHGGFSTLRYALVDPSAKLPLRVFVGYGPPDARPVALGFGSMILLLDEATEVAGFTELQTKVQMLSSRYRAAYEAPAAAKPAPSRRHASSTSRRPRPRTRIAHPR